MCIATIAAFNVFIGWQETVAVVPVRYVSVDIGKGLKLSCADENSLLHSKESAKITWIREGREDEQIKRMILEPNGVFELLNVSAGDAGNYSCTSDDDTVKARINVEVRSTLTSILRFYIQHVGMS